MTAGGFALDTKPTGFGLIRLAYYARAVHVSPVTDALYLVLESNDEPTHVQLPLPSSAVEPDGTTIFQFDADEENAMVYRYRGRYNLMPFPVTLRMARVRALTFTNLVVRLYANGVLVFTKVVANGNEFVLPAAKAYETYELELIGTSTVRGVHAVEKVEEFD